MTYREKAIDLLMERMGITARAEAEEIVDVVDKYCEYKPCVFGVLGAPREVFDWDKKIE